MHPDLPTASASADAVVIQLASPHHLPAVLQLQQANLRRHLSADEAATEGFVTAEYELDFLLALHHTAPSVVALHQQQVVGYALVAPPAVSAQHPLLAHLIHAIEACSYRQQPIGREQYVMVGQLCVAKGWRGQRLAEAMYQFFKQQYSGQYAYCCTDVALENQRSLRAHLRCGFQEVGILAYAGQQWSIVCWPWQQKQIDI